MYNFSEFNKAGEQALNWLKGEYSGIRTSRATPSILDKVLVESYGSKMPVNQVASVLGEGPRSIFITPWDKSLAPEIDRAVREANLGVSVSVDEKGVRVSFPDLTAERRQMLVKLVKDKLEEARITVRTDREKILSKVERDEGLSKDDKFRLKNDLQKLVDEVNKKLEDLADKKEREILE